MSVLKILQNACQNETVKEKYQKTRDHFTAGGTFRIFDDFQPLMAKKKLNSLLQILNAVILTGDSIDSEESGPIFRDEISINQLKKLIDQIATYGCEQLLDEHGLIKQEIIDTLNWENDNIDEKTSAAILCAYVGHVCQNLVNKIDLNQLNDVSKRNFDAAMICLSKNYGRPWTSSVLRSQGFKQGAAYLEVIEDNSLFAKFNRLSTAEKIGWGIGAAIFAGLVAGTFAFFTNTKPSYHPPLNQSKWDEEEKRPQF